VKTRDHLQIHVRQLQQANVDLQTANAAKDLDVLIKTDEISRYLSDEISR